MQVLFVGKKFVTIDGGSVIGIRNLSLLTEIYGKDNVTVIGLDYKSKALKLTNFIRLKPMGYSSKLITEIFHLITEKGIELVYLDNSLFGGLAKMIKRRYPSVKIITFFHNIEYLYFKHKVRVDGYYNFLMQFSAKLNENHAVRYSNYVFCLNARDQHDLKRIYGRATDLIVPIGLKDVYSSETKMVIEDKKLPVALFVGSDNFANIEGIRWFIENVSNDINCQLWVVGKGLDKLRKKYKESEKLKIFGLVDDLNSYYNSADLFINPVFSGSGMKTKTVEAMMYGKYIFGTNEAFEGFVIDYNKTGALCNTREEFIENINNFIKNSKGNFNTYTRELFIKEYENENVRSKLIKFLEDEGLITHRNVCL